MPHAKPRLVRQAWHKQLAIAATLVVASFTLGYATSQRTVGSTLGHGASHPYALQNIDDRWVQRVADYQSLYPRETVIQSDNAYSNAKALLIELEESRQLQTGIPDLSKFDYTFARAQHLGFEDKSLIQLVYHSPGKKPLALCFMAADGPQTLPTKLAHHENLSSVSWRENGQRYVIVAEENDDRLEALAARARPISL